MIFLLLINTRPINQPTIFTYGFFSNRDIEFLLDQFGEVLYPEQWMTECQGKPYSYTISVRPEAPPVEDANDDPDYMGDASVFIENVPVNVDRVSLEAWLKQGIQSETSQIEKMRKHLAKGMATIRGIEAKLQEVPVRKMRRCEQCSCILNCN